MFALVWKTAFIYFLILLTLRFMGKREVGQLGLFDFVVLFSYRFILIFMHNV